MFAIKKKPEAAKKEIDSKPKEVEKPKQVWAEKPDPKLIRLRGGKKVDT